MNAAAVPLVAKFSTVFAFEKSGTGVPPWNHAQDARATSNRALLAFRGFFHINRFKGTRRMFGDAGNGFEGGGSGNRAQLSCFALGRR